MHDDHGVLELRNQAAVGGAQGPAVGVVDDGTRRDGQERLDGEHEAFVQELSVATVDARHRRWLVQAPSDPVAVELVDDTEPVASGAPLHGTPHVAEPRPGLRRLHGIGLGAPGRLEKPGGERSHLADRHADTRIREVAVEFGRDVEVDEVAAAQVA